VTQEKILISYEKQFSQMKRIFLRGTTIFSYKISVFIMKNLFFQNIFTEEVLISHFKKRILLF